jgi:hypothetical protein
LTWNEGKPKKKKDDFQIYSSMKNRKITKKRRKKLNNGKAQFSNNYFSRYSQKFYLEKKRK